MTIFVKVCCCCVGVCTRGNNRWPGTRERNRFMKDTNTRAKRVVVKVIWLTIFSLSPSITWWHNILFLKHTLSKSSAYKVCLSGILCIQSVSVYVHLDEFHLFKIITFDLMRMLIIAPRGFEDWLVHFLDSKFSWNLFLMTSNDGEKTNEWW